MPTRRHRRIGGTGFLSSLNPFKTSFKSPFKKQGDSSPSTNQSPHNGSYVGQHNVPHTGSYNAPHNDPYVGQHNGGMRSRRRRSRPRRSRIRKRR